MYMLPFVSTSHSQTVISKPKERLCNHQADTKTTRLYTSKLTVYSGQTEPPIPVETEPLCFVI